ncbi:MAG: sigma-70 family RNA polymerase sigma factor [Flavobacteriaceae bacterium]|nr:sigma-70 family RNA polymerase sigma factor [Flavobacteriaceae bacterium]
MNSALPSICDESHYKKLYLAYSHRLYRFLVYTYGSTVDAEDITQNVFLKLWEECSRFNQKNIKSLIFTMGKNMSLNQIKRNKRGEGFVFTDKVLSNPESQLEEKEFYQKLVHSIEQMNETERLVFMMSRLDDLSYKEIANQLNISQKTVEKRMHKALKFLHDRLSVNLKKK